MAPELNSLSTMYSGYIAHLGNVKDGAITLENRGECGKKGLELVPGILVPLCQCVTVKYNIW